MDKSAVSLCWKGSNAQITPNAEMCQITHPGWNAVAEVQWGGVQVGWYLGLTISSNDWFSFAYSLAAALIGGLPSEYG